MASTPMDEQMREMTLPKEADVSRESAWPVQSVMRVVREYIERMWARHGNFSAKTLSFDDEAIDCPNGHHRGMRHNGRWSCVFLGCGAVLPDNFAPSGPRELEEIYVFMRKEMERERLLALALRVGATLSFVEDSQSHKFIG